MSAIDVAGPELAGSFTALGLIDEYRLYFRPFVLGGGKRISPALGRQFISWAWNPSVKMRRG